ncbi:uncharacterized protein K460DRAFT_403447 [Cucurbitaria berberidis CBS 394.84]|uniref:Uncharacterized protein n=1 Tax=Cucurbitaria berberidis CBS 394.84 TaxID=1168544 RepID=A0A9P4LAK8_9PLEO|nr:uncharacterized protein K460DRAFT_403447 [Cucurbitaria berberidis CBS 394.84]KAF1848150.1 hypothetical protein K460DRAFT_403447 [Cucurbitaria berberidis CBS 394.84]
MQHNFILVRESELEELLHDVGTLRERLRLLVGYEDRNNIDMGIDLRTRAPQSDRPLRSPTPYTPFAPPPPPPPPRNPSRHYGIPSSPPPSFLDPETQPRHLDSPTSSTAHNIRPLPSQPATPFHSYAGNRVRTRPGTGAWQAPVRSSPHGSANLRRGPPAVQTLRWEARSRGERERERRRRNGRDARGGGVVREGGGGVDVRGGDGGDARGGEVEDRAGQAREREEVIVVRVREEVGREVNEMQTGAENERRV